jgi:redox-sensitive bicupin YhaK (pirin superfamily)
MLRVLNDDTVAAGMGFGTHPHDNMEIITIPLEGDLAHKDSMGNAATIKTGDVQVMSAGTGIQHSEFNPNADQQAHLLQIWITPREANLTPSYTEWHPDPARENEAKVLVISPDGRDGSATIHQDADVYRLRLSAGDSVSHRLTSDRGLWLQVIRGEFEVDGKTLHPGDAISTESAGDWEFKALNDSEALLFDLR